MQQPSMPSLDDATLLNAFANLEIPPEIGDGEPSQYQAGQLRKLLMEKARRRCEALRIYSPMEQQLAAHKSQALRRIVIGGNRGGKTLWGAAETGWAVTGTHPYIKFPQKDGRCYIVGKDQKKLGEVLYRKLFRPGALKIIRDEQTGLWRSYRPLDPDDLAREKEAKPAPPIIPPRLVSSIAWENKRLNVPSMVTLTNGWELTFLTAGSKPPQGVDIDICLAGWSEIYDPVQGDYRRIDEIEKPFHVLSLDESTGEIVTRRASRPFIKGSGEIIAAKLSNGQTIFCTRKHRVLLKCGQWSSIQEAFETGAEISSGRAPDRATCHAGQATAEPSLVMCQNASQARPYPSARRARQGLHHLWREVRHLNCASGCGSGYGRRATGIRPGCRDRCATSARPRDERPRVEQSSARVFSLRQERVPVRTRALMLADVRASSQGRTLVCRRSGDFSVSSHAPCHGGLFSAGAHPPVSERGRRGEQMSSILQRSPRASSFYRNTFQKFVEGPSFWTAWCAGGESEFRPPATNAAVSGNWFRNAGSTSRIREPHRRKGDAEALRRETAARDRNSLASDSRLSEENGGVYVNSITSVCQAAIWDISVEGTHNYLYGGIFNHNCWFDEEITDPEWLPEMLMRLVDRRGRFWWTATPQSGTDQLLGLSEDADRLSVSDEDRKRGKVPLIERFNLPFWNNQYLGDREKRTIIDDPTLSDEDRKVRLDGQFAVLNFLMFPQFARDIHCVESCEPQPEWTKEPYSYLKGAHIPPEWCRYLVIDPGSVICAVLFAAVPPGTVGDYVYLYDELYIRECSAEKLAEEIKRKAVDQFFEAFIIDERGSQRSEHGTGLTVKQQYFNSFKRAGIKSRRTGHGFIDGCTDKRARCDAVRDWLRVRPDGTTKLRVVREKMPNWLDEMKRYKRKRQMNPKTGMREVVDEPDDGRNAHLMAATQYLAAYDPQYEEPPKGQRPMTAAQRRLEEKRKRKAERGRRGFVNLGP